MATLSSIITLYFFYFIISCSADTERNISVNSCSTLRILHLLPYSVSNELPEWHRELATIKRAGELAIKHINSNEELLQNFNLDLVTIPAGSCTRMDITSSIVETVRRVSDPKDTCIFAVVGLYCHWVTETMATFLSHQNFGYIQLSSSVSSSFTNTSVYPYLFRVVGSSEVLNSAIIAMMIKLNWTRINLVYDLNPFSVATSNDFVQQIEAVPSLVVKTTVHAHEVTEAIGQTQSRVTYLAGSAEEKIEFLCDAAYHGYTWPNFIYILTEVSISDILFYKRISNCTMQDIARVMEGQLILRNRLSNDDKSTRLMSGVTIHRYLNELEEGLTDNNQEKSVFRHANTLYDQILAFTLAMNSSLGEIKTDINSSFRKIVDITPHNRQILAKKLSKLSFQGASGWINFDDTHESKSIIDIFQIRESRENLVGTFDSYRRDLVGLNETEYPSDIFDSVQYRLPVGLGSVIITLEMALLIVLIISGVAMVYWKNVSEVKSTSLPLSLIILTGCMMVCVSSLLYTSFTVASLSDVLSSMLCNIHYWLFLNGTSLILVTLMFRLLRIYHFFHCATAHAKKLSDKHLILYVSLASFILILLLTAWMVVHPLGYVPQRMFIISANPPYFSEHMFCFNKYMKVWLGLSYGWIAMVLAVLLVFAIQTRHIEYKDFKDTKKVGAFIFVVTFIFCTCVPLTFILKDPLENYLANLLPSLSIAILCLCLIIAPKILPILQKKILKCRAINNEALPETTEGMI